MIFFYNFLIKKLPSKKLIKFDVPNIKKNTSKYMYCIIESACQLTRTKKLTDVEPFLGLPEVKIQNIIFFIYVYFIFTLLQLKLKMYFVRWHKRVVLYEVPPATSLSSMSWHLPHHLWRSQELFNRKKL